MNTLASGSIISWQIDEEIMEPCQTLFSWTPKLLWMVTVAAKLKDTCASKKSYD